MASSGLSPTVFVRVVGNMTFNSRAKLPKHLKKRGLNKERRYPTGERNGRPGQRT